MLIRALEPLEGLDVMRGPARPRARAEELCSGPGKLTQALGIGLDLNGSRSWTGRSRSSPATGRRRALAVGERIGITKAVELPWRFCDADSRLRVVGRGCGLATA